MEFWQGKTVLLTGHNGFKGSWLSLWLQMLGANLIGFALAPPTHPNLFETIQLNEGMINVLADIRDFVALKNTISKYRPAIIIHMAAQSLVRTSYQTPLETYATNIMGTVNLFEAARFSDSVKVIINVTSDKCYENIELDVRYREDDRLGGYDPYSSSKACSELITQTYRNIFFKHQKIGVATVRSGNVIGGGDWAKDRLIPDVVKACIKQENIVLRYPNALRPWQHVLQPLYGYLVLAEALFFSPDTYAESWNFGPDVEDIKPVSWVVDYLIMLRNSSIHWIEDKDVHPIESNNLQLDSTKAKKNLIWKPIWDIEKALKKTEDWFRDYHNRENMYDKTKSQIKQFVDDMKN
ncbi:MAG: CDP-glucose 4,6-dehydratase [Candidatus Aquirickettsiella sp.]